MYTSDDLKKLITEVAACIFFAVFGAVYEHFSFGVWSYCMVYAYAPFLAGSLVLLLMLFLKGRISRSFFTPFFLAQLTAAVGMLAAGVIEIYGTENRYLIFYPICAMLLLVCAAADSLGERKAKRQDP